MFNFRFIYPLKSFPRHYLRQAFFARSGRVPMRSMVSLTEESDTIGVLKLTVDWGEPGTVQIPWYSKRFGIAFYSTEVLRPRSEPFNLMRELIRGQMSRIFKRMYAWERKGLVISDDVRRAIQDVRRRTVKYLTADPHQPGFNERGIELFDLLILVSHRLLDLFLKQSLYTRKVNASAYPVLLGSRSAQFGHYERLMREFPEYSQTFQVWNPGMTWCHIEPEEGKFRWEQLDQFVKNAGKNHLEPVFGPIVRWDRKSLPKWLAQCTDEPYTIRQYLIRYSKALIDRYSSYVNKWVVASGIGNEMDHILVLKRIEWADLMAREIKKVSPNALTLVAVERPWGDSLRSQSETPPLELAESLITKRSFSGFLISLDFGLSHDATLPRDAFELNWLIDQWSILGRPLYFSFTIPSCPLETDPPWKDASGNAYPIWNPLTQQENLQRCFLSFLTRRTVHGIFWNRFEDISEDDTKMPRQKWAQGTQDDTKTFEDLGEEEETKTRNFVEGMSFSLNNAESESPEDSQLLNMDREEVQAEIRQPEEMDIGFLDDEQALVALSFPHSGLITTDEQPKPAFRKFCSLKNAYLG